MRLQCTEYKRTKKMLFLNKKKKNEKKSKRKYLVALLCVIIDTILSKNEKLFFFVYLTKTLYANGGQVVTIDFRFKLFWNWFFGLQRTRKNVGYTSTSENFPFHSTLT